MGQALSIIVIGAGEVGSYVAARLSGEGHEVALVERDTGCAASLPEDLNALLIIGSGTDPATLTRAGVVDADLFVAVTSDDETNIVSAVLAKQLGAKRSVVRVEHGPLRHAIQGDLALATGIDLAIDPDEETATEIIELIENPGTVEMESMAEGRIQVFGVRLRPGAPVIGRTLDSLGAEYAPHWPFLFAAISRDGETVIPRGPQELAEGDIIRVVTTPQSRAAVAEVLGLRRARPRRVVLLGGGRTAELVAGRLDGSAVQVLVAELDPERAHDLALTLRRVDVLEADITDAEFLADLELGPSDAVVALTGDDNANVLAALFAQSVGVHTTIAVAHRLSLLPLLEQVGVDGALSPRTATASSVLRFARGSAADVATFLRDDIELLEFVIAPDSRAAGRRLADLHLPKDSLIGAVISDDRAEIGRGSTVLTGGDRVVLIAKPAAIDEARAFFE